MENNVVKELHEVLMDSAIKFLASKNITDIDTLELYCDSLGESVKDGHWSPCTDSSCVIYHYDKTREQSI